MTDYDFSYLEVEEAYDNLVATQIPTSGVTRTIVRDRDGNVVINYRMSDGSDARDNATTRYGCGTCGQNVGDLVAHQDVFHPDVVQARNFRVLQRGR